jgi:hypothetical protein
MIPRNLVQLQPPTQLIRLHRTRQILLVRKHQQQRILHFAVLDDARQLGLCLVKTVAVGRIDDEDEALRAGEVVAPEWADLVLAADVPDVEFGVFVGDGFDVEADCGNGCDVLFELEVVEDSRLACCVESVKS